MLATSSPISQYFDLDGSPLDNGSIYFGLENQNPETAPVAVYWDAAGTQPAVQPIKTVNGYTVRLGTAAPVYVAGNYSTTIRNARGQMVIFAASSSGFSNSQALQAQISNLKAGQIGYSEAPDDADGTLGRIVQRIQAPTTAGWNPATFGPHNAVYGPGAGAGLEGAYSGGAPGDYNTFFGKDAGKNASTMTTSSGFGYRALYSMTGGEYNFAFGYNILSALTSGNNNTAVGSGLRDLVTGSDNAALGFGAGLLLAAGNENTFVGTNAYRIGASGEKNTVIGSQAAYALAGNDNVVIGQAALTAATTGGSNTVAGSLSGRVVTGVSFSSFWGAQTAYNKASGNECSYFGFQAGMNDATDFGCTAIGTTAGPDTSAFHSKSTAIGYGAKYTGSNQLILGGTGINAVNVGIGTDTPLNRLHTVGTAAGTAALRLDSTATTGVQSATWSAPTNKPGAASGTVAKWIPISLDGTTYYVPAWT
jgi:hypothetical protein